MLYEPKNDDENNDENKKKAKTTISSVSKYAKVKNKQIIQIEGQKINKVRQKGRRNLLVNNPIFLFLRSGRNL